MGIGIKLTQLMKERSTNANELALKANIPAQTVYSLIRRDASKVEIDTLVKIARALDVTADYFSSEKTEPPTTLAAHFDGDEYTPEELEEIRQFAEFVKNRKK